MSNDAKLFGNAMISAIHNNQFIAQGPIGTWSDRVSKRACNRQRNTEMTLDIGGAGEYRDIVKYNAQVGRWFLRSGDDESEIEPPTMVMDLANIAPGWLLFLEGSAPNRRMDPSLGVRAPQPSDSHKRGFMVLCFSPKNLNGVAELSSGSMHLSNAIKELHSKFEEMCGEHPGKLPVVACTGTTEKPGKFGTNHKPTFEIVDWTDRPEDLPDESPVDPTEVWSGNGGAATHTPASATPTTSPPPAANKPATETEALF